jgi:predicted alpha/beta hydrolase
VIPDPTSVTIAMSPCRWANLLCRVHVSFVGLFPHQRTRPVTGVVVHHRAATPELARNTSAAGVICLVIATVTAPPRHLPPLLGLPIDVVEGVFRQWRPLRRCP